MTPITIREFSEKCGRPICTLHERIVHLRIRRLNNHKPFLYDEEELKAHGIGNKTLPIRHKCNKLAMADALSKRNPLCPGYSECLTKAAHSNSGLDCKGCENETKHIDALNVDIYDMTREMGGSTVYRMPYK